MAQFYQGDSDLSIGGPARILIARATYTFPGRLSEIVNLTTYAPNTTYGWVDAGLTRSPTTISVSVSTNQWRNEQFGLYRTKPIDWTGQVQSDFLEIDAAHKRNIIMFATAPTVVETGEQRTDYPAAVSLTIVRLAVMFIDDFGRLHASVFPRAQWNGDAITQTISRGDPVSIPMTWTVYPDDDVIDTSGQAVIRYDIDQQ